jgi:membrane protease YdiL (CAAX protease family)
MNRTAFRNDHRMRRLFPEQAGGVARDAPRAGSLTRELDARQARSLAPPVARQAGDTNNAFAMVAPGSAHARRAGLPAPLAPVAVLLGVAAMRAGLLAAMGLGLGLRPTLVVSELMLAVPGLALLALARARVPESLGLRPLRGLPLVLCLAAGVTLWAASLGIFSVQYAVWAPPEGYLESFRQLHAALRPASVADALLSIAAIAVVPALCEETLFRGVVLASLRPAMGEALAVVTQAFLFGLIHLDTTAGGPPVMYRVPFAFAVGIALGLLRLRARSLAGPSLAHALLNTITFLAVLFSNDPAGDTDPGPALGLSLFAAGTLATAWILRALARTVSDPTIDSPVPGP